MAEAPTNREWKSIVYMVFHLPTGNVKMAPAKLDTASSVDLISEDTVNRFGMDWDKCECEELFPVGPPFKPIGKLTLPWNVLNKTKTRVTTFLVLDKKTSQMFDILLSEQTIREVGFYRVDSTVWLLANNAVGSHYRS